MEDEFNLEEFGMDEIEVELVGGPRNGQKIYLDPEDWRTLAASNKTRFLEGKGEVFEVTGGPLPLIIEGITYLADQADGRRLLRANLEGSS
jgi:hypothetical protein